MITGSNGISKATAFALLDIGYDKFVMGYHSNEENAQAVQKDLAARNVSRAQFNEGDRQRRAQNLMQFQAKVVMIKGSLDTEAEMENTVSAYFEALATHFDNKERRRWN